MISTRLTIGLLLTLSLVLLYSIDARTFKHPGILVNLASLKFVRAKIKSGAEPWTSALNTLKTHSRKFADLAHVPAPRASVNCGPYNKPNEGCDDERNDAYAAYTHALLWYFTGDIAHAVKAREILDAWPPVLKAHTGGNAKLVVAWSAEMFPRAAEIIRYTTPAGFWPAASIKKFSNMLLKQYWPYLQHGEKWGAGNWDLSFTDGIINMAVFLNHNEMFRFGIRAWRRRAPSYIYHKRDGAKPLKQKPWYPAWGTLSKMWQNAKIYRSGMTQETCRDLIHAQMGLGAMVNAAETAYIQGVDLYGEMRSKIIAALEFHAPYLMNPQATPPTWLCANAPNGPLNFEGRPLGARLFTYEIAYNHYARRLGKSLPRSKALLAQARPVNMEAYNPVITAWETLTHGDIGKAR